MCISVLWYKWGIPCQQCSKDETEVICFAIYEQNRELFSYDELWIGKGSQLCTYHVFCFVEPYDGCTLRDIIDDIISHVHAVFL